MARQSTGGAPGWRELRRHRLAQQRATREPRDYVDDDEEEEEERPKPKKRAKKAPARVASKASASKPRIGFLRASAIERAFIGLIYGIILTLVVASVVGTFYGVYGMAAPITQPFQIISDIQGAGNTLYVAIAIQAVLTIAQYGARQLARHDPRWWLLYLAALGVSVYFNVQAYYTPLLVYAAPGTDYLIIVACDILPEFMAIRHE